MAQNPAVILCPADVWTPVAINVTDGTIFRRSNDPRVYVQTFRLTGEAAPVNDDDSAFLFDRGVDSVGISSNSPIDIYIKPRWAAGEVRVDL